MEKREPKHTIIRRLGILTPEGQKTSKEVNLVKWEGMKEPVLDIRKWDTEGNPLHGISLSAEELETLCKILKETCPNYF